MRFSQANWITIDDAARSLTCAHCTRTLDLSGESFGVLGFVRTVSKLARQHFSCPEPGRDYSAIEARRQEAVARELAATIALEGEDVQRALEGRSGVVSIAKVLPMSRAAEPPRDKDISPRAGRPAINSETGSLCLVCEVHYTVTEHKVCYRCSTRYGMKSCLNKVRLKLQEAGPIRGHNFTGDGKLRGILSPEDEAEQERAEAMRLHNAAGAGGVN